MENELNKVLRRVLILSLFDLDLLMIWIFNLAMVDSDSNLDLLIEEMRETVVDGGGWREMVGCVLKCLSS